MGRLTRRVKFIARERRLSVPAEFLHIKQIERGDPLRVGVVDSDLYVLHPDDWERLEGMSGHMGKWFPGEQHPFFRMFETGIEVKLGSQDRVVLPRTFPYNPGETLRLHWEIQGDVLRLSPEAAGVQVAAPPQAQIQTSMVDFFGDGDGDADGPELDRREARRQFTERVRVDAIDHRDHTCSSQSPFPGEALVRSIRVEGIRHPVVLHIRADGVHQIVHGFRRVAAAQQLKMASVPALVFRDLGTNDVVRLKLLESDEVNTDDGTTLRRLQSTVKLYQGQVDLDEIEKITGRRKRTLQRYLRVAGDRVLREAIERGRVSIFKAEEILKAGIDPELAIRKRMTVKEIRTAADKQGEARRQPRRRIHRRPNL